MDLLSATTSLVSILLLCMSENKHLSLLCGEWENRVATLLFTNFQSYGTEELQSDEWKNRWKAYTVLPNQRTSPLRYNTVGLIR